MPEFERTMTVGATADQVFDYVSEPKNFPEFLPTVKEVVPGEGKDRVRIRGSVNGHDYDSDGYFRVDREHHRMEWSADGDRQYHGWLQVHEGDTTNSLSEVTIHLSFGEHALGQHKSVEEMGDSILSGMQRTLNQIRQHVQTGTPAAY